MFCLLAVKETSCVGHCNVVTLCVVISGCFNFKSIKKSGGWDRKCNMDHIMVIHGVGPRSSTNITLGAYCIPTKMKDQDLNWEFYYTKSLIEYLQRGQTGCERLQPKRRKIISSASPVSRIQLPPLCSWTKYKSIVMSFLYNGSLQMRNMHNPFPLVAPRTSTWCIFASFLSKIAFQAFMSFLLCWGWYSFTKPFLKECGIPTVLPSGY